MTQISFPKGPAAHGAQRYRTDFDQIWRRIRKMLYAYMRGQLIIAALIGLLSGIACAVLGLPDAMALGLVAGPSPR